MTVYDQIVADLKEGLSIGQIADRRRVHPRVVRAILRKLNPEP